MRLKISIFSFFISLLLTFSYSTYGDENCKNIWLVKLESSPYGKIFAGNKDSFVIDIESAFEQARIDYFKKVRISSSAADNIEFRFYRQSSEGKFIRQGEFEKSAEETDTEKGNPVFDDYFDLSHISTREDLVNRAADSIASVLSSPDNQLL
ncbi:MAG: hypothetical protein PUP46_01200 [Endozoicomonas sp. (ex Botrylloides leachii)]|nr:hypothetical protein [Endozoicomonas sp. (ex Botrylloides leachii)]